uniref:Cytochrome c oxidase subunit 5C n=1 Tax=Kalanchoe fedtschenkoi TaxID=63787 RepID=A0A7N0TIK9_KALFE
MAGGRVVHPTLKGPSLIKEIAMAIVVGLSAAGLWKAEHWNQQRKARAFYDMLDRGEISVVAEEEA